MRVSVCRTNLCQYISASQLRRSLEVKIAQNKLSRVGKPRQLGRSLQRYKLMGAQSKDFLEARFEDGFV